MELDSITMTLTEINEAISAAKLQRVIANYYTDLSENSETPKDKRYYERKAEAVEMCHSSWIFNFYPDIKFKDFQYVLHCHDKFCPVCQKLLARNRELKYKPVLDKFSEDYDIYHLVLTSPNVLGVTLRASVDKYVKKCRMLMHYLEGREKITGIDFSKYGYAGALRALEIVPNISDDGAYTLSNGVKLYMKGVKADYHIHYHVMLLLKKDLNLEHYITNEYSESKKGDGLYFFSELEILIQDIWYLLMNDTKVTKTAIDNLPLGYSCRCSLIDDGGYHQVFKYVTKTQMYGAAIPLDVFETLDTATRGKNVIQGYGIFRGLGLENVEIDEDFDPAFDKFIELMNTLSDYEQVSETPFEIRDNIVAQKCFYVSRKKYRGYLLESGDSSDVAVPAAEVIPDYLKPLPEALRKHLLSQAKQLSFDLSELMPALGTQAYFDGGRGAKPKKKSKHDKLSGSDVLVPDKNFDIGL